MKLSRFVFFLLALTGTFLPARAQNVVLDSNSNIVIEHRGPAAEDLPLASEQLKKYLLLALDRETLASDGATVRFVLEAQAQTWHQLKPQALTDPRDIDAFEIVVRAAPQAQIEIRGATVLATCYGVLHFLEHKLGVMWLFPGKLGLALPAHHQFILPVGHERIAPQVASRLITAVNMAGPDSLAFRQKYPKDAPLYDERIFFTASDYYKSLRLHPLISPSHNMINIFPAKETVEKTPELLPMLPDGTRYNPIKDAGDTKDARKLQYWHPCYTHPKAVEIAVAKARAAFAKGEMCFSLGINDGLRQQCQCETCKRVGWPNSYYQFVAKVADALKDQYPPRLIGVLVYGDVRHPTTKLRLPVNVFAMITGSNMLRQWSQRAQHIGNYQYFYGDPFIVPSFPLQAMAKNAREFASLGIASWRAETRPNWAWDAPKLFIQMRLLWNPQLDVDATLAQWCNAAFGDGGPEMTKFYAHWAHKWDYLAKSHPDDFAPLTDMAKWNSSGEQLAICTSEDFALSAATIARAKAATKTELQRKRLEMVETNFEYARVLFEMNNLAQSAFASDAPQNVSALFGSLQKLRARSEALQDEMAAHKEWREGTKDYERRSNFTIDKEIHSALITALFKLRKNDKLTPQLLAELPDSLHEYSGALTYTPIKHIEVHNDGIYYAVDYAKHRYAPMSAQAADGVLSAQTSVPNEVIEEGANADEWKQHWAFATLTRAVAPGRNMIRVEFTVKAHNGTATINLQNPWRATDADGLPVNVSLAFDQNGGEQTRVLYVEPVFPDMPEKAAPSSLRFIALWTPQGKEAAFEMTAKFAQVDVAPQQDAP